MHIHKARKRDDWGEYNCHCFCVFKCDCMCLFQGWPVISRVMPEANHPLKIRAYQGPVEFHDLVPPELPVTLKCQCPDCEKDRERTWNALREHYRLGPFIPREKAQVKLDKMAQMRLLAQTAMESHDD